jgi:glycolate oxidase
MDGEIPRRKFLQTAGVATTAAAMTLTPGRAKAEQLADEAPAAAPAAAPVDAKNFVVLHQIVKAGRDNLMKNNIKAWNYLIGAADTETTLKHNRQALDQIGLKPRMLHGVGKVDLSSTLLGHKMRIPVLLSGMGSVGIMDPDGGRAVARAASIFGVACGVSSEAKPGLEEIGAASDCPKLYQLYVRGDDAWIDAVAARAIKAGYTAFCFTVDSANFSRRERDIITGGQNAGLSDAPDPYLSGLNWDIVRRFKDRHKDLHVGIKGISSGEDAELAVKAGMSVVWVSTHGGRQLDHARGSMEVLPEVVKVAKGKATIIVDSGFSRGSDAVKGLATGADIVGFGKLQGYALGAAGEAGVVRMLELLEKEMNASAANLGAKKVAELNPSYLTKAIPVNFPSLFSAFPLLDIA